MARYARNPKQIEGPGYNGVWASIRRRNRNKWSLV